MATTKKLMGTTAVGGGALAIEDVFSTYLYTGNGSTQTITNGIDLAGEGGMVWLKSRSAIGNNFLFDTERGIYELLRSNLTAAEVTNNTTLTNFNSDGFSLGNSPAVNPSGTTYTSWAFRKAPRFFDVVTYTGNGGTQNISHNLGVVPGCVVFKRTDTSTNWLVWHKNVNGTDADGSIRLNTTAAKTNGQPWDWDGVTDTYFPLISDWTEVNASGGSYVAYLFSHDPLGPSGDGSDGLIACGSYTGNGSTTGPVIDLGWEPQWVMIKRTDSTSSWFMFDTMRGIATGGNDMRLYANATTDEYTSLSYMKVTATGFAPEDNTAFNASGGTYIYIAIRRGPMRQPESGTEVFAVTTGNATSAPFFNSNWPVDFGLKRNTSADNWYVTSRMQGSYWLRFNDTNNENLDANIRYDYQNGWWAGYAGSAIHSWMFRRAPGFFDVVAYTGNGVAGRTVPHNLGVAPEMMIVKNRDEPVYWAVYHKDLNGGVNPEDYYVRLNENTIPINRLFTWNDTPPTDTVFSIGIGSEVGNNTATKAIAYLFATLPGVSKVGSYTGNGSSQTIDCGFTSGARFILVKRTDSTGDWYVWDTERGIVAANDPHLSLNTTAAEVTTDDSVDPDSSGFIVNQVAATNINVSSASYIFYAVA